MIYKLAVIVLYVIHIQYKLQTTIITIKKVVYIYIWLLSEKVKT